MTATRSSPLRALGVAAALACAAPAYAQAAPREAAREAPGEAPRGAGAELWEAQQRQRPMQDIAVEHGVDAQDTAALEREIAALGEDGNYAVAEPGPLDRVLRVAGRLPEPASWALMILGFGGIAAAMRHRIRKSEADFNKRIRRITDGEE